MKSINELIASGTEADLKAAATQIYDGMLYMINTFLPTVQLSKDEWDAVAPSVVEKMQTPVDTSSTSTPTTTDAPGDDVDVTPSKADLVVTFVKPANSRLSLPSKVTRSFVVGEAYEYSCPVFKGYTADKPTLTGTMTAAGKTETVTYTKDNTVTGSGAGAQNTPGTNEPTIPG